MDVDAMILWILVAVATVLMGLASGLVLDHVAVQFPARRKLGVKAFADFKRAADAGNGIFLYPTLAIGSFIFILAALVVALITKAPSGIILPLSLAFFLMVCELVSTAFAAPIMLRISKMSNKEKGISTLMERFISYSYIRAVFIWLDALVLLYVLVIIF